MATPLADRLLSGEIAAGLPALLEPLAGGRLTATRAAAAAIDGQPLSGRAALLRDGLSADLPSGLDATERIVTAALEGPELTGWIVWPLGDLVAARALADPAPDAFERGLDLLAALTGRLTAEFSLRPFLAADLDRALAVALGWTADRDEHVRRLASEGTRPLLPWAPRVPALTADPRATLPILDALYRDPAEYVRRSVANHLNDLSRADAELAVATAARWLADPDASTDAVVRRALRTLVKRGDPAALELRGFGGGDALTVRGPDLDVAAIPAGGEVAFALVVANGGDRPARVAIDYVVHFVKASGATSPKVFKVAEPTLAPGQAFETVRRHSFADLSTRRHHPGIHAIELQVNGVRHGRAEVELYGDG